MARVKSVLEDHCARRGRTLTEFAAQLAARRDVAGRMTRFRLAKLDAGTYVPNEIEAFAIPDELSKTPLLEKRNGVMVPGRRKERVTLAELGFRLERRPTGAAAHRSRRHVAA